MRIKRAFGPDFALLMLVALAAGPALAADNPPAATEDGLELVAKGRLDLVYRRPGVDFSAYSKIMLDHVEVAFRKQWTRDFKLVSTDDRERIRDELSREFRAVIIDELETKGGYKFVYSQGPEVLQVTASIVELYINAPDTKSPGPSRTYTLSTGEATLAAELRDSESGEVIARVAEHERAREAMTMQWTTHADNYADVRVMLKKWAVALREGLDEARGIAR